MQFGSRRIVGLGMRYGKILPLQSYRRIQDGEACSDKTERPCSLWWDELKDEHRRNGKKKTKSWDRMVAKLKKKIISKDYQINLYRRLQNLKQRGLLMK
jgi:hypothetical protein